MSDLNEHDIGTPEDREMAEKIAAAVDTVELGPPRKPKALTARAAAQLAEQLAAAQAAQGPVAPPLEIHMSQAQRVEFKKQLWWGRELYSPIGLRALFPGVKTKIKAGGQK